VLNVDDFGAVGDGINDDTQSLHDVWKKACPLPSPAEIVVPAQSTYLIKPTDFNGPCQSNLTLKISGLLVAPEDPTVWEGLDLRKWLYFNRVDNFTVEGGGMIDGTGQKWWEMSCKTNDSNPCDHAPTAVLFHKCNNLKVRSLSIVNSQRMHLVFSNCIHVSASHLTVFAPKCSPNTDGIHISGSTHIELKDSIISTGDDCISIVGNSSQIRIKNIFCGPGHGISIGSLGKSNSSAAVQDVSVDGATLFNTTNGVRIKTWQGGSGYVMKISFGNITMQNVSNPIVIDQYYCDSPLPCLNQ
ncbi:polygalacturonase, partial [Genlisea aurea]